MLFDLNVEWRWEDTETKAVAFHEAWTCCASTRRQQPRPSSDRDPMLRLYSGPLI